MTTKYANGTVAGYIAVEPDGNDTTVCKAVFDAPVTGLQDVYFTFSGEGYEIIDWKFEN